MEQPKDLPNFLAIRVEVVRTLYDLALDIHNRKKPDYALYRRVMVFAGSVANELSGYQMQVKEIFNEHNSNNEIPHIMNTVLSAFKSYLETDEIKPIWKPWKSLTLKEA